MKFDSTTFVFQGNGDFYKTVNQFSICYIACAFVANSQKEQSRVNALISEWQFHGGAAVRIIK